MATSTKTAIIIAGGVLAGAMAAAGALTAGNALADNSSARSPSVGAETPGYQGTPGQGDPGRGMDGFRGGHRHRGGFGFGPAGRPLHGEFVVPDSDGSGTTTMLTQRGKVTANSDGKVTVKSSDNFTLTWTLNDDTRIRTGFQQGKAADLAVGDDVVAFGPKSASGATATAIGERPEGNPGTRWRGERSDGERGQRDGSTPSPSPSSSTQSSSFSDA